MTQSEMQSPAHGRRRRIKPTKPRRQVARRPLVAKLSRISAGPDKPATILSRVARRHRYPNLRLAIAASAATLLMVPYMVPAYADTSATATMEDSRGTVQSEVQSLTSQARIEDSVTRDSYTVTSPVPKPRLSFARSGGTFVNNPNSPIQWPFPSGVPIGSGFGYRIAPCNGCSSFHQGLDLNPGAGTSIQAIADGVVREVGNPSGAYGVYAIIDHQIDGKQVSSLYAHMAYGSLALGVGQQVKVGQLVGKVGNSGASTGAHLHLGIYVGRTAIDPYPWLTQRVK